MKFKTWEEMYRYLENEGDLYNPLLELYVFLYNEAGALCTYNISEEKAMELSVKSKNTMRIGLHFLVLAVIFLIMTILTESIKKILI